MGADHDPITAEAEVSARTAWATMSHLFMQSAGRFEGIAAALGLAPTDLGALLHLDPQGAPSQAELAEHWGCDASWVTAKVDGLEGGGLVARVPDPQDRRRKTIVLTPEGQRTQSEALDRLYDPPEQLTALGPDDLRVLSEVLAKVDVADPRAPGPRRAPGRVGGPPLRLAGALGRAARADHARRTRNPA